ncbi:MAG: biopolymer transporter ExbD [Alphaproteobacteria bacterium]|nr:biopolymer transporter ExbD [Alphaproteobacteria bacterium]MBL0718209.1 biopolymer transporter ExbD [Alphaproteobacteria bacterium]
MKHRRSLYRKHTRNRNRKSAEMSITPLIDLMMVILVSFMLATPLTMTGIEVNLPKDKTSPTLSDRSLVEINLNQKGEIFIFQRQIDKSKLVDHLNGIRKEKPNSVFVLGADSKVNYGDVIVLLEFLKLANFEKIALRTRRK